MVGLDHLYYAHLIDLVWSYLPFESLDNMAKVSVEWKISAALRKSRHFVATLKPNSEIEMRPRCLQYPGVTGKATGEVHVAKEAGTPYQTAFGKRFSRGFFDAILDMVGFDPTPIHENDFPLDMFYPGTIRWKFNTEDCAADPYFPDVGRTRVFFLQLNDMEEVDIYVDTSDTGEKTELVFNLACHSDPTTALQTPELTGPWCDEPEQADATIIFQNKLADDYVRGATNPSFIMGLLRADTDCNVGYTLVGLDQFFQEPAQLEAFIDSVRLEYIKKHRSDQFGDRHVSWLTEYFNEYVWFRSHEEYKESLGEGDEYQLYTVE